MACSQGLAASRGNGAHGIPTNRPVARAPSRLVGIPLPGTVAAGGPLAFTSGEKRQQVSR